MSSPLTEDFLATVLSCLTLLHVPKVWACTFALSVFFIFLNARIWWGGIQSSIRPRHRQTSARPCFLAVVDARYRFVMVDAGQCFLTGFTRIPRVPPKQTEIAWDEIRDRSSMRL